eukprot:4742530-Alexandrium_andersonii.AAC.1
MAPAPERPRPRKPSPRPGEGLAGRTREDDVEVSGDEPLLDAPPDVVCRQAVRAGANILVDDAARRCR